MTSLRAACLALLAQPLEHLCSGYAFAVLELGTTQPHVPSKGIQACRMFRVMLLEESQPGSDNLTC